MKAHMSAIIRCKLPWNIKIYDFLKFHLKYYNTIYKRWYICENSTTSFSSLKQQIL